MRPAVERRTGYPPAARLATSLKISSELAGVVCGGYRDCSSELTRRSALWARLKARCKSDSCNARWEFWRNPRAPSSVARWEGDNHSRLRNRIRFSISCCILTTCPCKAVAWPGLMPDCNAGTSAAGGSSAAVFGSWCLGRGRWLGRGSSSTWGAGRVGTRCGVGGAGA